MIDTETAFSVMRGNSIFTNTLKIHKVYLLAFHKKKYGSIPYSYFYSKL